MLIKVLKLFTLNERRRIYLATLIQIMLSFFDLLGIALIGLVGALGVSGVQSRPPAGKVASVIEWLGIKNFDFQYQVGIIAITATIVLILKTILSIITTRRMLHFLARRSASLTVRLISGLAGSGLEHIRKYSSQESLYALNGGVTAIMVGVVGASISLLADFTLLLVITIGLFVTDYVLAISSIFLFGGIGMALYFLLRVKARELGLRNSKLSVQSNEKILELLTCYREIQLRNSQEAYINSIKSTRLQMSETIAEMTFLPNISKFVIESAVVVGGLLIGALQFTYGNASHALASISIFIAASTRITPALLRIQQGAVTVRTSEGLARKTFELIEDVDLNFDFAAKNRALLTEIVLPIKLEKVSYRYPGSESTVLTEVNFEVKPGSSCGIIGVSGVGKSTLADLIIGAISPVSGNIRIGNFSPKELSEKYPGRISYVPQDVYLVRGTLLENIVLSPDSTEYSLNKINEVIDIANLREFVDKLPDGLETLLGEGNVQLSGGQKQRIGLARALYTNPSILVLDETTSALDALTEKLVVDSIKNLHSRVTVIVIAHRLSTIKDMDLVVHLTSAGIDAMGTFEEVRKKSQEVDRQATLMGL